MNFKEKRIESPRWTQAAKGQPCTLTIPNVCNFNSNTTVFCHLPSSMKGTGIKSDDICGADGCSDCHKAIDGDWEKATGGMYNGEDKLFFMFRALQRTIRNRYKRSIKW